MWRKYVKKISTNAKIVHEVDVFYDEIHRY